MNGKTYTKSKFPGQFDHLLHRIRLLPNDRRVRLEQKEIFDGRIVIVDIASRILCEKVKRRLLQVAPHVSILLCRGREK